MDGDNSGTHGNKTKLVNKSAEMIEWQ